MLIVKVPAKCILSGEHAVIYNRLAIATSISLYTFACIETSQTLRYILPDINLDIQTTQDFIDSLFQCLPLQLSPCHITDLLKTLALTHHIQNLNSLLSLLYLTHSLGKKEVFKMCLRSMIPVGAGLGSSASFAVAITTLLLLNFNHIQHPFTPDALQLINSYHYYPSCHVCESYFSWAFRVEEIMHGTPSGVDNTVCTYGGGLKYSKACTPAFQQIDQMSEMRFMIVDTRIPKNSSKQVTKVRELREMELERVESAFDGIHAVSLDYLVAFMDKMVDSVEIKRLIRQNQSLLRSIDVSTPKIDELVSLISNFGFTAKITGAGGGGCLLVYLTSDTERQDIDKLELELKKSGCLCYEVTLGCPGITLIPLEDQLKEGMSFDEFVSVELCKI